MDHAIKAAENLRSVFLTEIYKLPTETTQYSSRDKDFRFQYWLVAEELSKTDPQRFQAKYAKIIEEAKVKYPDSGRMMLLHPDVIANLKTLL
jgi:hypothetical protein